MKIFCLVILLFPSFLLNAQIKKGGLFTGGDLWANHTENTSTNPAQYTAKNSGFGFSPSFGWVVRENLIIGGSLLFSYYTNEQAPTIAANKTNRIGGGIWVRKYLPLGKSFYLFGNAGLNAQSACSKYTVAQSSNYYEDKGYSISASLSPGISFQIKKNLFLEAALNNLISFGYERKNTTEQVQSGNTYKGISNNYYLSSSVGSGVPLQIGMRWIIAKKA